MTPVLASIAFGNAARTTLVSHPKWEVPLNGRQPASKTGVG
ncbi:hypothetical protein [Leptolyngbya sp. 'hensonii']|nr:hypothetical protein [Leptolyngbya sp. 'hensonii']